MSAEQLITQHINTWTSALQTRSTAGRGNNGKIDVYGIKKLRELILELAVRGKLVPQDPNDEPASELLKRIAAEKADLVKQGKIKKQKPLPEISEDEKPFKLPEGWEWVRLGTLGYTQTGGTPSKSNSEYFGNDIPFIKPADITAQGVIYDNEGLSIKGRDSLGRLAPSGSILMVCIGTIGKCQIINRTCSFNQQINSITPLANIADFIYLDVSSSYFQSLAWDNSSSTTIAILNKGKWESLLVPMAPLSEQARIVTNVKKLMSLCDQLEQQSLTSLEAHSQLVETLLATLTNSQNAEELAENWARISQHFDTLFTTETSIDALKQSILQLAVMGKLVPQDPSDEPASELLKRIEQEKAQLVEEGKIKKGKAFTKMADKNKYTLPNGWIKCHLGDVIAISSGDGLTLKQMDSDGKIPVYGGNGITGYHNEWNIQKPTIVIGRVGYYCGSIHITPSLAWVTDNAFRTFHSTSNIDIKFLSILLKGTNLKENENATAQPVISASKIYPISIMLPPLNEQKRIFKKFNELISFCEALKSSLHSAQQTQLHLADALTDAALS
ncbi:restriction endonuclease subunit S [Pantoea agglomerans]|uniref:restriction endonuclease subunit S n=1 Tax=Enterobacter agglomerans TaxID=549 RepID=UPI003ED99709